MSLLVVYKNMITQTFIIKEILQPDGSFACWNLKPVGEAKNEEEHDQT